MQNPRVIYPPPMTDAELSLLRARTISARLKEAGRSQCRKGLVYFIRCESGPIKIGRARNAEQRLAELQTGNPNALSIVATVAGGVVAERNYHAKFAEHRLRGEWFAPHPDILAEIERLTVAP